MPAQLGEGSPHVTDFSLCLHMTEGGREFCGVCLIRALIPPMRVPPS